MLGRSPYDSYTRESMGSEQEQFIISMARADRWHLLSELIEQWHGPSAETQGYSSDEISACEKRLGVTLPAAVKEWYALAGRRSDIWSQQDRLLSLDQIEMQNGVLVFYVENQAVTFWGMPLGELANDDPPVVTRDNGDWLEGCNAVSLFALQMFVYTLQFTACVRLYGLADDKCVERIVEYFPELPLPPFLFPGGEFRFYGDRQLIITVDSTGHVGAVGRDAVALDLFRELIRGNGFEIVEDRSEA